MVEALATQSRRAIIVVESRKTPTLKYSIRDGRIDSKGLANVTIEEEEIVREDSKKNTETITMSAWVRRIWNRRLKGRSGYGTMGSVDGGDHSARGERKPPLGRGDSYFRDIDWRYTP